MTISDIAKTITASPTLALNARAGALRKAGEPVIHLGGGEPQSKAPRAAVEAMDELAQTREVRYAPVGGNPVMKQAVIGYTKEYYGREVSAGNVIVSGGAKQSIMVALQTVLNPGDEVIYPVPYWVSYPDMVRLCGAVGVPALPADGTFYPKLSDIENKVSPRTKAMIINSPNNPSGAMYSEEFIGALVRYCEEKGIYLIMDDIYHRLIFDNRKVINPYEFTKKPVDESYLIVVNGVSKQYAMTGFRVGWAVGSKQIIEVMTNIQGHQTSGQSVLLQMAAAGALNGDQSGVNDLRATLEKNRNELMDLLNGFEGVKVTKPDGTFYCLADFSAYEKDSMKLSQYLIDKVLVLTVPGGEFGMDGYLRISFCGSIEDIREGIKRIKWALDPDSPKEIQIGNRTIIKE
jgi:aspartate aminotransferase